MSGTFPDGFLWGCATSSYQFEGENRGADWWDWESRPGAIADGTRSGDACGWWAGRAEEDLATAAALGQNAIRLSLEWSRIEPRPGRFDASALERYAALLDRARALGLTPMVTLNHFTLPRWAAARGGWERPDLADRFAAYAACCAAALGSRVDLWATLNEPTVLMLAGHLAGEWPPGSRSLVAAVRSLRHQLQGHVRAVRAVRKSCPGTRVGLVLNLPAFDPARPDSAADRAAAGLQDWFMGGAVLQALRTGRVPPPFGAYDAERGLSRSLDFLGVNYYGRFAVQADPAARQPFVGMRHVQDGSIRGARVDWGQAFPQGLTRQLLRVADLGVPSYVTENGINDPTDALRPAFLAAHVAAVADALAAGADVRGYFHWSLLDNYEWAEGWAAKFGLLALDRETQARTRRPSAAVYEAICRANGLPRDTPVTDLQAP